MENKPTNEKEPAEENMEQEDGEQEQETEKKIGFKNQKSEKADGEGKNADWKKVESIVNAAKGVYESGKSNFREVIESMIATLGDLLVSENGSGDLGGLYGGPQMDIPAEPEEKSEEEQ